MSTTSSLRTRLLCAIGAIVVHQACGSSNPENGSNSGNLKTGSTAGASQGGNGGTSGAGTPGGAGAQLGGSSGAGSPSGEAGGASKAGDGGASGAGQGGVAAGGAATGGNGVAGSGGVATGGGGQPSGGIGGQPNGGIGGQQGGSGGIESWSCPSDTVESPGKLCFLPSGQSEYPLTDNPYEGTYYVQCGAMVRAPGDPCPSAGKFHAECSVNHCGIKQIVPTSEPFLTVDDRCCFDTKKCLGGSGCGRPLRIEGLARNARLSRGGGWG